mmetsp:Transcript_72533/g.114502  ORF Transcript_72533/g.114502 Transcript_72533/m.114502 type:complete len:129 (+) Transcript_72533:65-451(+)
MDPAITEPLNKNAPDSQAPTSENEKEKPSGVGAPVVSPLDSLPPAAEDSAQVQPEEGRRGVLGFLGRVGYRIFDNMSFVGEVMVEFLELDKPRYHNEIQAIKKQRRREERARKAHEAAEVASLEEADE